MNVSATQMPTPEPAALQAANEWVDTMPYDSQFEPSKPASVSSIVQPGRVPSMRFFNGNSRNSVAAVRKSAGASWETCHRAFHPTVASGSL